MAFTHSVLESPTLHCGLRYVHTSGETILGLEGATRGWKSHFVSVGLDALIAWIRFLGLQHHHTNAYALDS